MAKRLHPITDIVDEGMLDVGDGHVVHWTVAGSPDGKPAVLLHGGPGSGSSPRHRQMFDPTKYRIVQIDQRNSGQSTPSAATPEVDLSANTTLNLIADIEQVRTLLGIDRWLVWGGSWGTTLGLAYAQAHPASVTELVLASVVTTSEGEVDWITRSMARVFPERWREFVDAVPPEDKDDNLATVYNRLLMNPDPGVHQPAAAAWCDWEHVHVSVAEGYQPSLRNADPEFQLCFARLVTHYWANAGFLEEGQLLRDIGRLDGIPVFLAHGRLDISGPADIAVALAAALPDSELFVSDNEGHGGPVMTDWLVSVLDRV